MLSTTTLTSSAEGRALGPPGSCLPRCYDTTRTTTSYINSAAFASHFINNSTNNIHNSNHNNSNSNTNSNCNNIYSNNIHRNNLNNKNRHNNIINNNINNKSNRNNSHSNSSNSNSNDNNNNNNNNNSNNNCNNLLWHPISSSTLPPFPFPLPPYLPPPAAPASAETPLQPEPAHLNRSSTIKTRISSEVTESLFASGGYNTPPSTSPFLPVAPYDLVAKDYHQSIAFSQANSIFVQSQTGFSSISKKTETCFGRWEQHSTLEPLHIQVPPLQPMSAGISIKTEGISCGSSRGSSTKFDDLTPQSHSGSNNYHLPLPPPSTSSSSIDRLSTTPNVNGGLHSTSSIDNSESPNTSSDNNITSGSYGHGGLVTTMPTSSPTGLTTTNIPTSSDLINGCSRTIPISWSSSTSSSSLSSSSVSSTLVSSSLSAASSTPSSSSSSCLPVSAISSIAPAPTSTLLGGRNIGAIGISSSGSGGLNGSELTSSFPENLSIHSQNHQHHQHHHNQQQHHATVATPSSATVSSSSSLTLLQIKREPCQVSEITTSNNLGHHQHQQQQHSSHNHHNRGGNIISSAVVAPSTAIGIGSSIGTPAILPGTVAESPGGGETTTAALAAVVKVESPSPKSHTGSNNTVNMDNQTISASQNSANAIPVGIAVARQRLQEHTTVTHHQPKEINRFGIGIADMGSATSVNSQNMFFTGTNSTMIPLSSEALSMGVSNVQNAVRTPPTFWQYPTPVPVESMLPMPIPPVGFQLVRDPNTGQYLFLPAAATIEPFQPTVVWPTYPQPTAALQPPHLLLPPLAQSLQPPPLAPLQLLGSDYLTTASTTLHQHTQTHSTRFVALTSDAKRKSVPGPTVPLPIPHHAVIKIEDCNSGSSTTTGTGGGTTTTHHHQQSATIFGDAQFYYHQPPTAGLIQIAPSQGHPQAATTMQECNSLMPSISPPPLAIPAALPPPASSSPRISTCLASPLPLAEQSIPDNLEASTSCVPEVQDATIQTDTPIGSEDDNTADGTDECSLPSQEANEGRGIVGSEVSLHHIHRESSPSSECHNVTSNVTEDDYVESGMTTIQNDAEVDSSRNDSGFDSNAVTSTNSLEEVTNVITADHQWCSNNNTNNNSTLPIDVNIIEGKDISMSTNAIINNIKQQHQVTSTPVDLSGLELLSNISIEAIEKKITFIKQEPLEDKKPVNILTSIGMNASQTDEENNQTLQDIHQSKMEDEQDSQRNNVEEEKFANQHEQLGGLNLLCALAEQRIQEEVGKRHRKRSSSSSESHGSAKKKKHKHSKSNKKERKEKRRNKQQSMEDASITEQHQQDSISPESEVLTENIKETFRRVKAKYSKCSTCKVEEDSHCCKEKCDWPTPEELMLAMESDMRLRLADITRQCQEKKRELEEICPIIQQKKQQHQLLQQPILQFSDRESTPVSSKGSIRSFKIEKLNQQQQNTQKSSKFTCESPSLSETNGMLGIVDNTKTSSDTESSKFEDNETCSSSSSKRKGGIPRKHDDSNTETIVAKKPKSLVGYILASKNRITENGGKDTPGFLTDETTVFSELSYRLKVSAFSSTGITNSLQSAGGSGITIPSNLTNVFSSIKQEPTEENEKPTNPFTNDDNSTQQAQSILSPSVFSYEKIYHRKSSKHHSKHKKSKSGNKEKKRRRSSEIKERKRKIDARCTLTSEHLDKDKTRVLTAMGGLFYAGYLSPLQPPDVYAVTLDGERGNRPHIMSCEEVLRDAILEVCPNSVEECPPGTRLCAYWSQQYRCLYPGTAAEPGTPDIVNDRKFISVEFDDGDSGRIALEDIRFLLSDYPIVEYDPNPLLSLGKRKRRISHNQPDQSSQAISNLTLSASGNGGGVAVSSGPGIRTKVTLPSYYTTSTEEEKNKLQTTLDKEERRKLKKMKKERLKKLELDLSEGGGGSSGNGVSSNSSSDRKHKKKHKCNDENCKHRKHKKRKKHKKHHHRENSSNTPDSSQDIEYSQGDGVEDNDEQSKLRNLMVNDDNGNLTGLLTTGKIKNREELPDGDEEHSNIKQNYSLILSGQDNDAMENPVVFGNNNDESQNEKKTEKEDANNFNPDLKEDTMTEEDVASSITESSGSVYEPKKKKERQNSTSVDNHSKIAAFLPARQLWAWAGKGHKRQTKGRARKQFYKSIQRGKETISVGDSAVFLSTGRPDRPYIGRIECMWETSSSNKVVRVRWFYHPEETVGCPNLKFPGALFESLHEDENDVQTISHKCEVLSLDAYTKKFGQDPKQYQSIYDNNDTYYLAGHYDPTAQNLNLQSEIPTLAENDKWV